MKVAGLKFLQAGLLLVFIFLPLFFGSVHAWSSMSFCAALFLLFFFFPESVARFRSFPGYFQAASLLTFGFLAAQAAGLSADPFATQTELLKWLACAAAFLLASMLPEKPRVLLLAAGAGVVFFEACYGLVQTGLGYDRVLWRAQETHAGFATGTFLNRNHLAGLLQLGLGIQLGFLLKSLRERRKVSSIVLTIIFLVTFTALVKTGSRMGLTSFLLSVMIFCFSLRFRAGSFPRPLFFLILACAAGLALFLGSRELAARFSGPVLWEQSWGGRELAWKSTLALIKGHFWLGTGLGTYDWVFPRYQPAGLLMGWNHAHNDYLELSSGLGVPLFAVWGLGILGLLAGSLRRAFSAEENVFPLVWGILAGLFSFLAHGLTDFNWAIPSNAFWFFFLLAAALAFLRAPEKEPVSLKPVYAVIFRAAVFILALFSAQKAWAGVSLYAANRAFLARDFSAAAEAVQKSVKMDPFNRAARFLLGKSLLEKGKKESDAVLLQKAENVFSDLTREMPFYGRAWAWLGLSKIAVQAAGGEKITEGEWKKIQGCLLTALDREPSSAWLSWTVSKQLLAHSDFLNAEEKQRAFELLVFGLTLRYEGQASIYLQPALEFLWKHFRDFELLEKAVPRDYASYRVLLGFIEEQKIWAYRSRVYPRFLEFAAVFYEAQCQEGRALLAKRNFRKAFEVFQRADWARQEMLEAKAGMLAARSRLDPVPYSREQANLWLGEILEQEEMPAQAWLEDIRPAVQASQDPYLQGLWAYRSGQWQEALQGFNTDSRFKNRSRRWRADALKKTGEAAQALELLRPALDETNPDLRELILLKNMDSSRGPAADLKIREILELSSAPRIVLPAKGEKSEYGLNGAGIWLNLLPGETTVKILIRSKPYKGEFAYVRFQIWEGDRHREAGDFYVSSPAGSLYSLNFKTSGGLRLLTVGVANGAQKPGGAGPEAEFGAVKVKTS